MTGNLVLLCLYSYYIPEWEFVEAGTEDYTTAPLAYGSRSKNDSKINLPNSEMQK